MMLLYRPECSHKAKPEHSQNQKMFQKSTHSATKGKTVLGALLCSFNPLKCTKKLSFWYYDKSLNLELNDKKTLDQYFALSEILLASKFVKTWVQRKND